MFSKPVLLLLPTLHLPRRQQFCSLLTSNCWNSSRIQSCTALYDVDVGACCWDAEARRKQFISSCWRQEGWRGEEIQVDNEKTVNSSSNLHAILPTVDLLLQLCPRCHFRNLHCLCCLRPGWRPPVNSGVRSLLFPPIKILLWVSSISTPVIQVSFSPAVFLPVSRGYVAVALIKCFPICCQTSFTTSCG